MEKHFCDWCSTEIPYPEHALRIQPTGGTSKVYGHPERIFCSDRCGIAALELDQKDLEWNLALDKYMASSSYDFEQFIAEHGRQPSGQRVRPPLKFINDSA